MHLGLALAGGDAGLDLIERLAANVENMARLLKEESGTLEGGSVGIHLADLKRLAGIGILGEDDGVASGFPASLNFLFCSSIRLWIVVPFSTATLRPERSSSPLIFFGLPFGTKKDWLEYM